ncbi:MAG: hypothetical protein D6727_10855 [Gammaproteobacteria bacterium]|nr:MAG: hypothetical protein D6727_10855 [Gammaproteobacteria bacterium]
MKELQAKDPSADAAPPSPTAPADRAAPAAAAAGDAADPRAAAASDPAPDASQAAAAAGVDPGGNGGQSLPDGGQFLPPASGLRVTGGAEPAAPRPAGAPLPGTMPSPATRPLASAPANELAMGRAEAATDASRPPALPPALTPPAATATAAAPAGLAANAPQAVAESPAAAFAGAAQPAAPARPDAAAAAPALAQEASLPGSPAGGDAPGTGGHDADSQTRGGPGQTPAALRDILLPSPPGPRAAAFAEASALASAAAPAAGSSGTPAGLGQLLGSAPQALPQQPLQPLAGREQFAQGLGERLTLLAGNGLQAARIQLHPERLGALDVRIELDENNARVWFHAQHGGTRDAIEQALPRLRELFAGQGLELLQADVSGGRQQAGHGEAAQRQATWSPRLDWPDGAEDLQRVLRVEQRLSSHRLLDVRA